MSTTAANRIPNEEELRDLGFGSVVSRESQQRLLNRDGTFNVERRGLSFFSSLSPYHALLTMSWTKIFSLLVLGYLAANSLFAMLYWLAGPEQLASSGVGVERHPFLRAFFFSVETLSTIGYGHIVPVGLAANILVTLESLLGLLSFAIVTGILFARFSRPTAKILFSRQAVVAPYRGMTALEFRIANARSNQLIELEAKVLLTRFEMVEGIRTRRYYYLDLERSRVAFFPLSWTVVHPIDERSPLFGQTNETLQQLQAEILILLTGFDETFSQTVHTRSSYTADELVWGAKFSNIFLHGENEGPPAIDISRLDSIEPASDSKLLQQ